MSRPPYSDGDRDFAAEIGCWLRERREQLGWSQRHTARVSGVARQTIIAIEQGCCPTLPVLFRLCSTYGVRFADLGAHVDGCFEVLAYDAPEAAE